MQAKWQRERVRPAAKGEPISAGDEQRLIQQLYEEHLKKAIPSVAPPTVDPSAKPLTYEEQKQVLIASMPLDEEALRGLALQRAEQVREQLTGQGKLADEQVYLLDVDLNTSDHEQIRSRLAIEAAP